MSALSPYRVVDLTTSRGWTCGKILADLGADVVKVDLDGVALATDEGFACNGSLWRSQNTSKRSVVLDIGSNRDRAELERLVRQADFVLESSDPGRLDAIGFGWDGLVGLRADVVLTSITPFGQDGPRAGAVAGELELWAAAGILHLTGDPDRAPVAVSVPQTYAQAATEAAAATLVAHMERVASGQGQHVDVSIQQALVDLVLLAVPICDIAGIIPQRTGWAWRGPRVVHRLCYPCKDGFVTLGIMGGGASAYVTSSSRVVEWMVEHAAAPEWLSELDFTADYDAATLDQHLVDRVEGAVAAFLATRTKAEVAEEGLRRGILAAPVNTVKDILASEQLRARGFWIAPTDAGDGLILPGAPVAASQTPARPRPAPLLGQDRRDVARGWRDTRATGPRRAPPESPLAGLHVLELATAIAGPMVGRRLAAWGADVVRVESHRHPDTVRTGGPFPDGRPGIDRSALFADVNAGKRSVALDIANQAAAPVLAKLVGWADVVIAGFRPGVAESLGLGYEDVRRRRPDCVYLATSMQGSTGPYSATAGFGNQAGALAGVSEVTGWPDREPSQPFGAVTDFFSPRVATATLLAALDHRRRTGDGQLLDQSQLESATLLFGGAIVDHQLHGAVATRVGNRAPHAAPHGVFPVRGTDRYCTISVWDDEQWTALARVAGGGAVWTDRAWSTLSGRKADEDLLEQALAAWTATRDGRELVTELQLAGVPSSLVFDIRDVLEDEQLRHRGYFTVIEHPAIGAHTYSGHGFRMSRSRPRVAAGPCLGADTDEVLVGWLGMTTLEVEVLRTLGVVTTSEGPIRQTF